MLGEIAHPQPLIRQHFLQRLATSSPVQAGEGVLVQDREVAKGV